MGGLGNPAFGGGGGKGWPIYGGYGRGLDTGGFIASGLPILSVYISTLALGGFFYGTSTTTSLIISLITSFVTTFSITYGA